MHEPHQAGDHRRVAVVIEDEADIRDLIAPILRRAGFTTHFAATGRKGVQLVREHNPTVVTLDVGLPDIDGLEVSRRIRSFSDAYLLMLTARADEADVLMGLESGADDYLVQPFRLAELRARVQTIQRRPRTCAVSTGPHASSFAGGAAGVSAASRPLVLAYKGLELDLYTRTVHVDGQGIELTRTEFDLLQALLETGRRVLSRLQLISILRGGSGAGWAAAEGERGMDERGVDAHLGNLRRKIGDDAKAPRWLETVRGVGYRLAP